MAAAMHECKAPLTVIQGVCDMLASGTDGPLNQQQGEQVQRIQEAGRRLGTFIDSVRHVESLPYASYARPVQLQTQLQAVIEEVHPSAAQRQVGVEVRAGSTSPVIARPASMYYMFTHLVTTIVKHAPPNSTVALDVRQRRPVIRVRIALEGDMATPEMVERVRASLCASPQPGGGSHAGDMNWYIVRSIVEFFGGSITVSSQLKHALVSIKLPMSNQMQLFV